MRAKGFIEGSLRGALALFQESIFAEYYASRRGLLQALDPRIKVATFLLFISLILFAKGFVTLLTLYILCLMLTAASRIDLWYFLKRTWVFVPLFSLFIAIPAIFNLVTPGDPLVAFNVFAWSVAITRQGLNGAAMFVLRVLTSVSFVILLGLTTRHFDLLKVLRIFGIPSVFVMTIGMCARYIYMFVETIENIHQAIKSRVGSRVHYKKGQRLVAWNIASLWNRSYQFNEAVYNAMRSRGYRGEPVTLDDFRVTFKDAIWLFFVAIFTAVMLYHW